MISENSRLPFENPISLLINELDELDEDVFLFLDDYRHLSEPAIHQGLSFFLRSAPPNFHLVLTTRSDPPLPLPRLRAQNQMLEVDAKGAVEARTRRPSGPGPPCRNSVGR